MVFAVKELSKRKQRVVFKVSVRLGLIFALVWHKDPFWYIYIYIYINDLSNDIKCKCKLFTNDKSLFSVVYIIDISENDLNHDLEEISEWNFQSKMNFNPNPTKQAQEIIFSRKNCFYSSSRLF